MCTWLSCIQSWIASIKWRNLYVLNIRTGNFSYWKSILVTNFRTARARLRLRLGARETYSDPNNLVVDSGGTAHPAPPLILLVPFLPSSVSSSCHILARIRPGSVRTLCVVVVTPEVVALRVRTLQLIRCHTLARICLGPVRSKLRSRSPCR